MLLNSDQISMVLYGSCGLDQFYRITKKDTHQPVELCQIRRVGGTGRELRSTKKVAGLTLIGVNLGRLKVTEKSLVFG